MYIKVKAILELYKKKQKIYTFEKIKTKAVVHNPLCCE